MAIQVNLALGIYSLVMASALCISGCQAEETNKPVGKPAAQTSSAQTPGNQTPTPPTPAAQTAATPAAKQKEAQVAQANTPNTPVPSLEQVAQTAQATVEAKRDGNKALAAQKQQELEQLVQQRLQAKSSDLPPTTKLPPMPPMTVVIIPKSTTPKAAHAAELEAIANKSMQVAEDIAEHKDAKAAQGKVELEKMVQQHLQKP